MPLGNVGELLQLLDGQKQGVAALSSASSHPVARIGLDQAALPGHPHRASQNL
jgi:hypothetical protein